MQCINPRFKSNHPEGYNLNKTYIEYIINERKKKPNFKYIKCNNDDNICIRHKYNSCAFLHKNDPI